MLDIKKKKIAGVITGISLAGALVIGGSAYLIKYYFRNSECDLDYDHLHVYKRNFSDVVTVFDSERMNLHGYSWTNEIKPYSEHDIDRIHYMEKKDLVSIYDNSEYLKTYMEKNKDYDEYEYFYQEKVVDYYIDQATGVISMSGTGNVRPVYKYVTKYDYTADINHSNLTGAARTVHKKYYAYNIKKDNDEFTSSKSEEVDDIMDLAEMYPYFKPNSFSKTEYINYRINLKTKVKK